MFLNSEVKITQTYQGSNKQLIIYDSKVSQVDISQQQKIKITGVTKYIMFSMTKVTFSRINFKS